MSTTVPISSSEYRHKKVFEGFRDFISRGNMIDMAVGVVMGNAVTQIVTSLVKNLINPLIAMIFGKPDMGSMLQIRFNHATISFGAILNDLLNFFLVAAAIYFCIILPINKLRDLSDKAKGSSTIGKMKFWKHAKKGSTLDKVVKAEQKVANDIGLTSSSSPSDSDDAAEAADGKAAAGPDRTDSDGTDDGNGTMGAEAQARMIELLGRISSQLETLTKGMEKKEGGRSTQEGMSQSASHAAHEH